ncbi:MAG: hypothetical protein RIT45_1629 [Pseudomonadota bacterium]
MNNAELARRHATLLGNLPGMAYRCANSPDWPMEIVSEGAEALTGHSADAFLSGRVQYGELIVSEDRDAVWSAVQAAVERQEPFRITYRIEHADGSIRHIWEQGRGVFDADGQLLALEGFICDVSDAERARAEAERARTETEAAMQRLHESEAISRTILERASDGIMLGDPELRIVEANQRMAAMLGVHRDALVGRHYVDLLHPDDLRDRPLFLSELQAHGSLLIERRMVRGDGSYGHFEISVRQLEDQGVIAIARDISARREKEDATLAGLRDALMAEHQSHLELLVHGVGHDFNNLLAAILGSAELLRHRWPASSEGFEHVERVLFAADRASVLVRQLMSVAGDAVDATTALPMAELVEEALALLPPALASRVQVEVAVADPLPPVRGDAVGIQRVLSNLLTNAIEAQQGGTGHVWVQVSAQPVPDGSDRPAVCVEVRDDGVGFDSAIGADAAQKPYVSTKGTGRGIGLAAVRGIVRAHRGHFALVPRAEGGTSARFWLPVADAQAAEAPRTPPPTATTDRARRVLVVDDELDVRSVLMQLCTALGWEADGVESGEAALRALQQASEPPECVLLDVTMPGMGGVAAAEAIVARWPEQRVVMMSGQPISSLRLAQRSTEPPFLLKPFGLDRLRAALESDA